MQLDPRKLELPSKATYKLDQMRQAVRLVGNPQKGRRTIIVAGTNGKGSTCTFLTHLFLKQNFKVGTFISPHVVRRTERILINGKNISESLLKKYEKKYVHILNQLTFFEKYTLLAFLIFRDQKVDLQILEVGMGGRLDATNIAEPDLSVITRIDYDHQQVLGKTLTQIAREKAGIMRKSGISVLGFQKTTALKTLKKHARSLRSKIVDISDVDLDSNEKKDLQKIENLNGLHQRHNAQLAYISFRRALELWKIKPVGKINLSSVLKFLPPARIQIVRQNPLWIIDGSHNENSLEALDSYLNKHARNKRFKVIFGVMDDKDIGAMLNILKPWISSVYLPNFYLERQMPREKLLQAFTARKRAAEMVSDLDALLVELWKSKSSVLVVGSLYLAGDILLRLQKTKILKRGETA